MGRSNSAAVWVKGGMAGTPTGLVLALLAEFAGDTREAKTINQLALSSGKAYANVHAATTALLAEQILTKETIGHSHRCRLNLANDKTLLYLSLLQTVKRDDLLRSDPAAALSLAAVDEHGPRLGVLLAWHCGSSILLITDGRHHNSPGCQDFPASPLPVAILPLGEFLADAALRATVGRHTLLFGHALYASIMRERGTAFAEVRR